MTLEAAAVDRIAELAKDALEAAPKLIDVGDETYSTVSLHRIREQEDEPAVLTVHSLRALTEYLEANRDELAMEELIVHVVGPTRVDLLSNLVGDQRQRFTYLRAETSFDPFQFSRWVGHEEFVIALQSQFVDQGDRADVLKVIGNLKDSAVRNHTDDGMTQEVTAKAGIAVSDNVVVPNPVTLAPYRTFPEVEQPESRFVLRVRKGQRGPEVALFEADGGAWRIDAAERVKSWVGERLPDGVTLIA